MNSKINTENVFRDRELDQGFILRANDEVAKLLKSAMKTGTSQKSDKGMQISLLDPTKRCYGLQIEDRLYLGSLVDLPCIIEAQKTLDYKTFYKSCDAAQMLYIHNFCLEQIDQRTEEEKRKFIADFNPLLDDEQFFQNLYQRKKLKERLKRNHEFGEQLKLDDLKWRHGLTPATQNVRNVRHKVEPIVDTQKVHQVELILKSIIETGFAENCKEELLEFDDEGKLIKVTPGIPEKQKDTNAVDEVMEYKGGSSMAPSGNPSFYNEDQSVVKALSIAPSSIQFPQTQHHQAFQVQEDDLPQNEQEYINLKLYYRQQKHEVKEKKSIVNQMTEKELLDFKEAKTIKKEIKRELKMTERLHPEWKQKNTK